MSINPLWLQYLNYALATGLVVTKGAMTLGRTRARSRLARVKTLATVRKDSVVGQLAASIQPQLEAEAWKHEDRLDWFLLILFFITALTNFPKVP